MKVILKNPEIGHGPGRVLAGRSGKVYGVSKYSTVHRCQTVEMSLDKFLSCSDDIWRATGMVLRRWWPVFVSEEAQGTPSAVAEFADGYALASDGKGIPDGASHAACLGWGYAHGELHPADPLPEPVVPLMEPVDQIRVITTTGHNESEHLYQLAGMMRFGSFRKWAKDNEDVAPQGKVTKDSLIAAILEKRVHDRQRISDAARTAVNA